MTSTVRAVYLNGVLKPVFPLPLAEGQVVDVTVTPDDYPPPLTQEEALQRIREAKTLQEMWAAGAVAATFEPDDGSDPIEEMEKYRRETGQRPLFDPPYRKGQP